MSEIKQDLGLSLKIRLKGFLKTYCPNATDAEKILIMNAMLTGMDIAMQWWVRNGITATAEEEETLLEEEPAESEQLIPMEKKDSETPNVPPKDDEEGN